MQKPTGITEAAKLERKAQSVVRAPTSANRRDILPRKSIVPDDVRLLDGQLQQLI